MDENTRPVIGMEAISPEMPVVKLSNGSEKKLERIGWNAIMAALKIFSTASSSVLRLGQGIKLEGNNLALALLAAVPYSENHAREFVSELLGVKPDELSDTKKYVGTDILRVIRVLPTHPDFKSFLYELRELKNMKEFGQFMEAVTEEPKKDSKN